MNERAFGDSTDASASKDRQSPVHHPSVLLPCYQQSVSPVHNVLGIHHSPCSLVLFHVLRRLALKSWLGLHFLAEHFFAVLTGILPLAL